MKALDSASAVVEDSVAKGLEKDDIVRRLHELGFDALTAIKALRAGLSVPLAEAKTLLVEHEVWADAVEAGSSLSDAFEEIARSEGAHRQ